MFCKYAKPLNVRLKMIGITGFGKPITSIILLLLFSLVRKFAIYGFSQLLHAPPRAVSQQIDSENEHRIN